MSTVTDDSDTETAPAVTEPETDTGGDPAPAAGPPASQPLLTRSRVLPLVTALGALAFFLAGFFLHSSGSTPRLQFHTVYQSTVDMQSTITQSGSTATLKETFTAVDPKKGANGTMAPCLPSGSSLQAYSNMTIAIPDGCVLKLKGGDKATITASGPISVLLGPVGPSSFSPATTLPPATSGP